MAVRLRFPDSEEGREAASVWEGIHGWGEAGDIPHDYVEVVEHSAPAGLGGEVGPASLSFSPSAPLQGPLHGRLACRLAGRQVASLPVSVDHLGSGDVGMSLGGSDLTGSLTFRCRIGPPVVSLTLTRRPAAGLPPAQLLPPLRLLAAARGGAEVELVLPDGHGTVAFGSLDDPAEGAVDREYLDFLEDLAVVQDRCAAPFAVPDSVPGAEVQNVARLARLLREGSVDEPATTGFVLTLLPGAPALDRDGFLLLQTDGPDEVLGHDLDTGVQHTVIGPCRLERSESPVGPPGTTRVVVAPEPGARQVTRLGPVPSVPDEGPPLIELSGRR